MKHKYVFYFPPKSWRDKHGKFLFFSRVKDGKEHAKKFGFEYDYSKIY